MSMPKHYSVRTVPGGGENFITTVLTNHYGFSHNVQYYDRQFNEYFINSELIVDSQGDLQSPFWTGTEWTFTRCRLRKANEYEARVVHEHEWLDEGDEYIRRFNVNKIDPQYGVDPDRIIEDTIEGFWITCTSKEETDFVKKIFIIKRCFGSRPPIIFTDKGSSLDRNLDFKVVRSLSSVGNDKEVVRGIQTAMDCMSYSDFMGIWINYYTFLKSMPLNYTLSYWNSSYLYHWLIHRDFELCDLDNYIIGLHGFIEKELRTCPRLLHIDPRREIDMKDKIQQLNSNVNIIQYKDLFLDQTATNTVLDNYSSDISEYTHKNKLILNEFEDFYGEISL